MKEIILASLNNIGAAVAFVFATKVAENNFLCGILAFILAYIILDYHTYYDDKLGHPNNLFF
jgi:hypothetical protein